MPHRILQSSAPDVWLWPLYMACADPLVSLRGWSQVPATIASVIGCPSTMASAPSILETRHLACVGSPTIWIAQELLT
eukprot:9468623-Pyramimonas_sp.AAC.1